MLPSCRARTIGKTLRRGNLARSDRVQLLLTLDPRCWLLRVDLTLAPLVEEELKPRRLRLPNRYLADKSACQLVDWSLRTDVGMTCGGRVKLFFEPTCVSTWPIVVFGAGHVAQALAQLLAKLPCQAKFIDPRSEWLDRLPEGVDRIQTNDPSTEVTNLPSDAFVLCMTKGHKHDFPVLVKLLQSPNKWPYVGVIGSKSKKAVLEKELREAGITEERLDFHCPIGLPIGSNHPMEIAVSIAAQILAYRDEKEIIQED